MRRVFEAFKRKETLSNTDSHSMQVYLTRKKDEAEIFHRKKVKNKNIKLKLNSESMRLSFNS